MDIREAAGIIPVLQKSSPATFAALAPYAILKRFKKGEHLFFDKDEVNYVYFLLHGTAALYKLGSRHEKRVLFICGPGEMLNELILDEKPVSVNCELLTDSRLLCFDRMRFLYICEQDFRLAKAVMDAMTLKIRRLYRQIKNTGNTVRGDRRIAAKLWKLSGDYGEPCPQGTMIGFDLTITYLADLLGLKRETVSRQLKLLTEKGLVIVEKTRFVIPDRDKLKEYFYDA